MDPAQWRLDRMEGMELVELLAPAGSEDSLKAAVESGADAIYLAGNFFGARAYANNFDEDGLAKAIRFAHLRGVRIHVTVNTVVNDSEIPALRKYLRFLYEAGTDAILVQDLGVARLARETVPSLPLHASTQMTVHSLAGVLALQELGFERVVLSRELSLDEIRYICANCQVEIEVFMHGALCVCYSGQCLMSSMIGGRSGNRGRCAQPCRLPYTLVDETGQDVLEGAAGKYLLSPRDLNTIDLIPQLIDAGVSSLKIEGRMKRPEYVAAVVQTYRQAIDTCYKGTNYQVTQEERDTLAQIFNRDFTTAYLTGRPGKHMMSDRRPNNRGLLIGRVSVYDRDHRLVTIKLNGQLANGDQVDFWVKVGGRVTASVQDMTDEKGRPLQSGEAGDLVRFCVPMTVHEHDRVFKVYDGALMERTRKTFRSADPIRRIPVNAVVRAAIGKPLMLRLTDKEGHTGEALTHFIGEPARNRPLTEAIVRGQIERLGTSVYSLNTLTCSIEGSVMIPMSELNDVRRRAVEDLDEHRLAVYSRSEQKLPKIHTNMQPLPKKASRLMVSVETIEQMRAAIETGADGILFGGDSYHHQPITPNDYQKAWGIARETGIRIDFNLPRIIRDSHQKAIENLLVSCRENFEPDAIHVHNIGALSLVKNLTRLPIHADYSLIAYNLQTLEFLRDYGAAEATLSPELNIGQIRSLAANSPLPLTCIVHGKLELMVSEYCVIGSFLGGEGQNTCTHPCTKKSYALKDRKDALFPLVTDQFCHMHILNSKTLSMMPHVIEFESWGIHSLRIEAKAMNPDQIRRIVRAYQTAASFPVEPDEAQKNWIQAQEGPEVTRGHYFRGVL